VLAGLEADLELKLLIGSHVPTKSYQRLAADGGNPHPIPTEPGGLPSLASRPQRAANGSSQRSAGPARRRPLCRLRGDTPPAPIAWITSVDEVGITAGDAQIQAGSGQAQTPLGTPGPAKPEGAGGQKWTPASRTDVTSSALAPLPRLVPGRRIAWLAVSRAGRPELCLPGVRKGGVDHKNASTRSRTLNTWAGKSSRLPSSAGDQLVELRTRVRSSSG